MSLIPNYIPKPERTRNVPDQKPVDYVYFRCQDHDVFLQCPHRAYILEPLDPSDLSQGFTFDLDNFFCPETGEDNDDPECLESWTAVIDE